jgi:hypothetical protein
MRKKYYVQNVTNTFCPECQSFKIHNTCRLLMSENCRGPSFYICRLCGYIGQIGVGPVEEWEKYK